MISDMNQAQAFISALPHAAELGIEVLSMAAGEARLGLPYGDHLIGDPESRVIHGGAVFALMDTCCGAAVMSHPSAPGVTATLDLRMDYMRSARPGQMIVTHAVCYHVTRSIAFVRATTYDDDTENPVAAATGAFTVQPRAKR